MAAIHVPVLLRETLEALDLHSGLTVVDGTVGGGGHSRKILERIQPDGILIGLDRDPLMLQHSATIVTGERSHLCHANYRDLPNVLRELQLEAADRILVDLGLASDQLADRERGFGFSTSGPLDMRFDVSHGESAAELLSRDGRATRDDLSRVWRRAIQPGDCRANRDTAIQFTDSQCVRFGGGDRRGLAGFDQARGSQRTGDSSVSGVANRRQSRVGAPRKSTQTQFVRVTAARRAAGGDHVSFVGRPFGQARISG